MNMALTIDDLIIRLPTRDPALLLSAWRWLVDESFTPLFASVMGDLFLCSSDGHVHWLDTGMGQLSEVADSAEELSQLLQQSQVVDAWFMPSLVEELRAAGVTLGPGRCYSYKVPPVLGGTMDRGNFEPAELETHLSLQGQLQEQEQGLPGGTLEELDLGELDNP
jgi:hypothetical protein